MEVTKPIASLVDGNWSDWDDWSDCPVTCGGGVQERTRTCTNPPAQFGGEPCPGESEETRPCKENPCPSNFVIFIAFLIPFILMFLFIFKDSLTKSFF